jgi:alpha-D-xyloside xylohydrolase
MRRVFALAIVCACSSAPEIADQTRWTVGSGRYRTTIANGGRDVALLRGEETLLAFAADGFELGTVDALDESASYDPAAIDDRGDDAAGVTFRVARSFRASEAPGGVAIDLDYGDAVTARITIAAEREGTFRVDVAAGGRAERAGGEGAAAPVPALVRVRARTSGDPGEGFYGLGEWEDTVDHRGKLRAMQIAADSTIESTYNEDHVPIPFLAGTHGWGIFAASRRVGSFDVARKDPSIVEVTFAIGAIAGKPTETFTAYLFGADAAIDLPKRYYDVAGLPRLPAPWALGPWIWRDENKNQAEVEDDIATIRKLDLATSGIWVDHPYSTAIETFDFDPARYTDPRAMIDRAHAAGLRFALWSVPYLEKTAEPFVSEATSRGYFPPRASIPLNPWSSPIDFTNKDAYAYWVGLVHRYTDLGVEGFKLDYAEDVAPALGLTRNVWGFADGSDERTMHHGYSALFHRAYSDALPEDRFLLCRAAHWGEQTLGLVIWPGDMDATFTKHGERFVPRNDTAEIAGVGGLPATIVMGLSLGVSGFPFFGADTGGYRHSPPDAELYVRWFEQTALSSVMQVGDGSSQPPWVFTAENGRDDHVVDTYRTYARLHMRLFAYEWSLATRIATDGRPIQRPLGFVYPELGVHPSDEYLFGDDLLVAPVITPGERTRRVILPRGTWIDFWDGTPFTADTHDSADVDAPLDKLPLLLREGAIVPLLRPTIDTLAPADDPDVDSFVRDPGLLWSVIAPGPPRRFVVWDGTSIERTADGSIAVASGTVFTKGFVLELIGTPEPTEVARSDGATIARTSDLDSVATGWTWLPDRRGTLRIKLPNGTDRVRAR